MGVKERLRDLQSSRISLAYRELIDSETSLLKRLANKENCLVELEREVSDRNDPSVP